jgi:hypothetical protein
MQYPVAPPKIALIKLKRKTAIHSVNLYDETIDILNIDGDVPIASGKV